MSTGSKIEWTDATWSPVVGCTRVSPGCDNCYAVAMTRRLEAMGHEKYADLVNPGKGHFNGVARLHAPDLDKPLRWRKPRRVFVNPMSDLFHEALSDEEIAAVFGVMAAAPRHTFQVLTKRPERAVEWFGWVEDQRPGLTAALVKAGGAWPKADEYSAESVLCAYHAREALEPIKVAPFSGWPLPNVWLGVSAEDQPTADLRVPEILLCPAAVHFVSYEPALGSVDFHNESAAGGDYDWLTGEAYDWSDGTPGPLPRRPSIDWIIAGGESGPGARPPKAEWFRSVRDQCAAAGVSFLFKQWGKWAPYDQLPEETRRNLDAFGAQLYTDPVGPEPFGVGKKRAGRELDGKTWDQFPELSP